MLTLRQTSCEHHCTWQQGRSGSGSSPIRKYKPRKRKARSLVRLVVSVTSLTSIWMQFVLNELFLGYFCFVS